MAVYTVHVNVEAENESEVRGIVDVVEVVLRDQLQTDPFELAGHVHVSDAVDWSEDEFLIGSGHCSSCPQSAGKLLDSGEARANV